MRNETKQANNKCGCGWLFLAGTMCMLKKVSNSQVWVWLHVCVRVWACGGVCFKLVSLAQMLQYANKRNSSRQTATRNKVPSILPVNLWDITHWDNQRERKSESERDGNIYVLYYATIISQATTEKTFLAAQILKKYIEKNKQIRRECSLISAIRVKRNMKFDL